LANIKKTNPCTKETINSRSPNKPPNSHIPILILVIRDKRICPALILANSRKHKVTGRTLILTSSTSLRKGTKYQGEPTGNTVEQNLIFTVNNITLLIQNHKAILKLNLRVVVIGKL